ncbi:MAG: hypothetical protein V2A79_17850 [Planctomycetota bacterium]
MRQWRLVRRALPLVGQERRDAVPRDVADALEPAAVDDTPHAGCHQHPLTLARSLGEQRGAEGVKVRVQRLCDARPLRFEQPHGEQPGADALGEGHDRTDKLGAG